MNIYRTWSLFHRSERRYHRLSYQFGNMGPVINGLNDRRRAIQREISELSGENMECAKCRGACCRGDYDHFTVIDYLTRAFSDKPLKQYGEVWKPKPLRSLVLDTIRSGSNGRGGNTEQLARCPHLSVSGCDLEAEDRPMRCVLWTCKDFRRALPPHDIARMGRLMKELDSISRKVIRIYAGKW